MDKTSGTNSGKNSCSCVCLNDFALVSDLEKNKDRDTSTFLGGLNFGNRYVRLGG